MGARLREARRAKFKSAAKAAAVLGLKSSTYAAHENGQNEFGPDAARFYGKRFGVSAAWLLTGDDDPRADRVKPAARSSNGMCTTAAMAAALSRQMDAPL